jgi:hypothetical protein
MIINSMILASPSSALLRFFVYPGPKGSEEPTPRAGELYAVKINLLPLGMG